MTRRSAAWLSCALLLATAGCGETLVQPKRADLVLEAQWAAPVTPLVAAPAVPREVSVLVRGEDGRPVRDVRVVFAVLAGDGVISSNSARTDAQGLATISWTFGNQAGPQLLRAIVPTLLTGGRADFSTSVVAGPPVSLNLTLEATSLAVGGSENLTLVLRDAMGNVVPPASAVVFSSADDGVASVSPLGGLSGVATGTTVVTATSASLSDTALVRVGAFAPTLQRTNIPAPGSGGIAFSPGRRGYLGSIGYQGLWQIDGRNLREFGAIGTPTYAWQVALDSSAAFAYVTDAYGGVFVDEINLGTGVVSRRFTLPHYPWRVLVAPDGGRVFASSTAGVVHVIDRMSAAITTLQVPNPGAINGFAASPDGQSLAVTSSSGWLTIFDAVTLDTLDAVDLGAVLQGVAYSPGGEWLYVARPGGTMLRLNAATLAIEAASTNTGHNELIPTSDRRYVLGSRWSDGLIEIFDARDLTLLSTEAVVRPLAFAREPGTRNVWVTSDAPVVTRLRLQ